MVNEWRRNKKGYPSWEAALNHIRSHVADIRVTRPLDRSDNDTQWIFRVPGTVDPATVEEKPAPPPDPNRGKWFLRRTDNANKNPSWHLVGELREVLETFVEISTLSCGIRPYQYSRSRKPHLYDVLPSTKLRVCRHCERHARRHLPTSISA